MVVAFEVLDRGHHGFTIGPGPDLAEEVNDGPAGGRSQGFSHGPILRSGPDYALLGAPAHASPIAMRSATGG